MRRAHIALVGFLAAVYVIVSSTVPALAFALSPNGEVTPSSYNALTHADDCLDAADTDVADRDVKTTCSSCSISNVSVALVPPNVGDRSMPATLASQTAEPMSPAGLRPAPLIPPPLA